MQILDSGNYQSILDIVCYTLNCYNTTVFKEVIKMDLTNIIKMFTGLSTLVPLTNNEISENTSYSE